MTRLERQMLAALKANITLLYRPILRHFKGQYYALSKANITVLIYKYIIVHLSDFVMSL